MTFQLFIPLCFTAFFYVVGGTPHKKMPSQSLAYEVNVRTEPAWGLNALIRRSRSVGGAQAVDGGAKDETVEHVSKKAFSFLLKLKNKSLFTAAAT